MNDLVAPVVISGKSIMTWMPIPSCTPKKCSLKKMGKCKVKIAPECLVEKGYVDQVYSEILEDRIKGMTSDQKLAVGTMIIPLYHQLVKFKMMALVIDHDGDSIMHSKAGVRIHPIFREIRETMKAIDALWRSTFTHKVNPKKNPKDDPEAYFDEKMKKMVEHA